MFEESISLNIIANPAKGAGLNQIVTQLITIEQKLANIAKLSAGIRPLALGAGAGITPGQAGGLPAGQAQFGFMGQIGQAAKATETLNQKTQKMGQTFVNTQKAGAQYGTAIIENTNRQGELIRTYQKADGTLTKYNQTTGKVLGSTKKMTTGFMGSGQALMDIVKKVAVWTIVTTAIFKTVGAITKMVKEFIEFTQMMARVQTVTRATIGTLDQDMERLAASVYTYMRKSSASFKDTGEALYHLGSAGMDVREQMAGLAPIMNLTIATFGNLTEVARLAAGSYNVFGESIEGAMTTSQKFKYISDLLAFTYSKQQVELSEIANAMTLVGSAAGVMQIPFSVLVGTIGELNTGMLKGCYSVDTELLTDKGWKYFKDLDKTEKVATLNPDTQEIEYQTPIEYIDEPYKGKMYHIKNTFCDLKVTPNHKIYSRYGQKRCKTRKYELRRADEVFGKEQTFIRGGKWRGREIKDFILPSIELNYGGHNHQSGEIKIKMEDWLEFLGWYLSEGCCGYSKDDKKNTSYKVKIYQSPGEKRDKIKKLLERLPFKFYEDFKKPALIINSKQLYLYLKQFGLSHEKYISNFIKELSPRLLEIFIKAYTLGDGRERDACIDITTSSTKMRDGLEEIGLKAGYAVSHTIYPKNKYETTFKQNHDLWKIYLSHRTEFSFNQSKNLKDNKGYNHITIEEWIDYDDRQYCVEVEKYHTLFIRRNGKTVWCGNTRAGTSLMNAFIALAQKSGQLKTQFGLVFDPSAPLDFVDIMEQMHAIFGDSAISLEDMGSLMQTFGRRGGRAIASILGRFEEWRTTVGKTEADFRDFAEEMRETAEDTLPKQFSKFFNLIKTSTRESFRPMEDRLKNILKVVNKTTEAMEKQQKAAELAAKISGKPEARGIPDWAMGGIGGLKGSLFDFAVKKMQELEKETKEAQKNIFEYALIGAGLEETVNEIYETEKKTNKERKERKDLESAILKDEKLLEEILKSQEDVAVDIQGVIGDIVKETSKQYNLTKKNEEVYTKVLTHLAEQYELTGSIGTATSKLTKEIERQSELIKEQSRYRLMAVQGASELEVAEEKILGWIAEEERKLAAIPKATREAKREEIERAETLLEIAKTRGLDVESSKELIEALTKTVEISEVELKILKLLIAKKEKRIAQEERIRNEIVLTHKYNMMQLQGYTEIAVIQTKINDLVKEIRQKESEGIFTGELRIRLLGLENEKIEAIQQRVNDIASTMRDDIAAGLDDIITGSGDLESIFVSIGNTIRKEMVNTLVESSGLIQGLTQGLGGVATGQGGAGKQIEVAFNTGGETAGENIKTDMVSAGEIVGKRIKADIVAASQAFRGGGGVTGGVAGGGGGIPTGWMPQGYQPGAGGIVASAGAAPGGVVRWQDTAQSQGLKYDRLSGKMITAGAADRQSPGGFFQSAGFATGMNIAGAGMAGYATGGTRGAVSGMAGMAIGMALTPVLGPLGPVVGALIGMAMGGGKKTEEVTSTWQPQRAEEAGEKGFRGEGYAPLERLYPLPESAYFSGRAGGQGMGMDNSIHIRIDNVNGDAEGIANRIAGVIETKIATKYRRSLSRGINITFPRA